MIFDERGVQILKQDGTYFLGIEDGGHMSRYWEFEISKEDAEKVMQDIMYSSKLLLNY